MTLNPSPSMTKASFRSGHGVTAVLGPTNTGKTHLAIERMTAFPTGMIGLPLRLLAREVYQKVVARVGTQAVALITGEEKIIPKKARYYVCTVEAMPRDLALDFVAVDEVQLAGNLERGHVFTDRLLNLRGRSETMLLGALTVRGVLERLLPGITIVSRPRMSQLTWAGPKKLTRQPRRSAIVSFSANDVYAIAELIRRQRGGAAVVMGALSPRTRNAQVELYQSGDVDFLVATDAIGMGLNLDVDHVAFAGASKYDGFEYRPLTVSEMGQIAGRAGRHTRDGTFGVTGEVDAFDEETIERLETHVFDIVKTVQWRNSDLDYGSLRALRDSLDRLPPHPCLSRALPQEDVSALDAVLRDGDISALADRRERVALLWDVCQLPDFRKVAPAQHAELVATVFRFLCEKGTVPDSWFARRLAECDKTEGDIDTLSQRIAQVRTWTFIANRNTWLNDPAHWQERTRALEDRLSDALHERLTQRFVDRRTSVLMRRLREKTMLDAEILDDGDVRVEGQHIGWLEGFRFTADATAAGQDARALTAAASRALSAEIDKRAGKLSESPDSGFALGQDGGLRWQGALVAKLAAGDDVLKPRIVLLSDEHLSGPSREKVEARLSLWLTTHIATLAKPLFDLRAAEGLEGIARGLAFRLSEALGTLDRRDVLTEVRDLEQTARAGLRQMGVRFGAYHLFVPALLKPAPAALLTLLFALKDGNLDQPGLDTLPHLSASGRTSIPVDREIKTDLYRITGFRALGNRAVRLDILERLADLIRPLLQYRPLEGVPQPEGIAPGGGFTVTVQMTSLLGCAGEDFNEVLKGLGYRMERVPAPVAAPAEAMGDVTGEAAAEQATPEAPAEMAPAPDAPAPDAPTETPATDGANEDATAVEPAMLEVWRQGARARTGKPRGEGERTQRSSQPREGRTEGRGEGRPEGRGDNRKRGQNPRHEGGRSDARGEGRGRPERPRKDERPAAQAKPARRERQPDPDSPFAKLAALLDKKDGQ